MVACFEHIKSFMETLNKSGIIQSNNYKSVTISHYVYESIHNIFPYSSLSIFPSLNKTLLLLLELEYIQKKNYHLSQQAYHLLLVLACLTICLSSYWQNLYPIPPTVRVPSQDNILPDIHCHNYKNIWSRQK